MADSSFAGTECEKKRYLEEYFSRCEVREALEMERREFERMGGQTDEVLRVWVVGGCMEWWWLRGGGGGGGGGGIFGHGGSLGGGERC